MDGSATVVDCRPAERRPAKDAAKFEATEAACALLGWEYRLLGAPDPVLMANVRWLAGYRHPRHDLAAIAGALRAVFETPLPLLTGAERAGDPLAVLPVCSTCCGAGCSPPTWESFCVQARWCGGGRSDDVGAGGGATAW